VFAQMAATTLGIPFEDVHVVSTQDTDITPSAPALTDRARNMSPHGDQTDGDLLKEKISTMLTISSGSRPKTLISWTATIVHKPNGKVRAQHGGAGRRSVLQHDAFGASDSRVHLPV
jgi:xanthine dehydrogenase molybdenum-binding subunit